MKLYRFLLAAAPALMFAACSDDKLADEPALPGQDIEFKGDGFIGVNINLPTETGTRAENDKFDDGLANEYNVSNGMILLFKGADENNATFQGAYLIGKLNENNDVDNDGITISYQKAIQIENFDIAKDENVYALCVFNYDQLMFPPTSKTDRRVRLRYDGSKPFEGTFRQFRAKLANYTTDNSPFYTITSGHESNFFMTNAPISKDAGGTFPWAGNPSPSGKSVTTLALLDKTKIKTSELDAKQNPAASIFVERAVAKTTLTTKSGLSIKTADMKTALEINSINWKIMSKEDKSYVVRYMGADNGEEFLKLYNNKFVSERPYFRFVGDKRIGLSHLQPEVPAYRTYWAVDPHYGVANKVNWKDETVEVGGKIGTGNPQYCFENTFKLADQNRGNANFILINASIKLDKAKFSDGNFYTVNDDQKQIYNWNDASSYLKKFMFEDTKTIDFFKPYLKDASTKIDPADFISVTWAYDTDKTEVVTVKDISLNATNVNSSALFKDNSKPSAAEFNKIKADIVKRANTQYRVVRHVGGANYYKIYVKHFGDDLTPWDAVKHLTTDSGDEIYPAEAPHTADELYLGRFGMVRNNWYAININKIGHLGSPTSWELINGEDDDEPIEDVNKFVGFTVNILSWAKRVQNTDL